MYVIFPAQDVVDWGYNIPTLISPVDDNNYCLNNNFATGQSENVVTTDKMSNQEYSLKQLSHPAFNEAIKLHNGVTFKLVKTVSDFAQQLATIHERHAEELQSLVETFRKRNADLRRERPLYPSTLFNSWETFLQEVEVDSQIHSDIASILGRHVSIPILERTFHRKVQSRKIFIHRESCETILSKTEELLFKCFKDYGESYERLLVDRSPSAMEAYIDAHNAYVQQLHASNAIVDEYHNHTLPHLLEEMEEVYIDLSDTVARSVLVGAEIIGSKTQEQASRYDVLVNLCKAVNSKADLEHYIKSMNVDVRVPANGQKQEFRTPQMEVAEASDMMMSPPPPIPYLKNEVIVDKGLIVPMKSKYDALKKEANELESKLRGLQETLESLVRLQQRSLDSSLFNKANEIQEDISLKRFDLRVSQIHLAAVKAQIDLLVTAFETKGDNLLGGHDRKMSSASTGSIKSKWLKAFKSLKSGGSGTSSSGSSGGSNGDRRLAGGVGGAAGGGEKGQSLAAAGATASASSKNGANASNRTLDVNHIFQEYTYKKITACDACHEILKGHTRQGMRCKMCKLNVHNSESCQEKVGKCQPKPRLLRRQKSTSEIETRPSEKDDDTVSVKSSADSSSVFNLRNPFGSMKNRMLRTPPPSSPNAEETTEIDPIYQLLKQAGDLGGPSKKGSSGSVEKELTGTGVGGQGGGSGGSSGSSMSSLHKRTSTNMSSRSTQGTSPHSLAVSAHPPPSSCSAPHSPQRQKLNLRMKSLSLDSPESNEHVQRRRGVNSSGGHSHAGTQPHSSHGSSHSQSPQSPVHSRRLLATRAVRMSSVDLPDENEKSLSSASTSPCPSPKPHRLLPTNLYVVLYNFKSRHQDELDLKAGYTVTVVDTSDPDWWKGKCLGKLGYFPSKYVAKLNPGERPLQVTHNLQVSDGDNGLKLLRDQIVIQVSDESEGMVPIRCGDRQGSCPLKYLQEV